jgi:hypothetical protein
MSCSKSFASNYSTLFSVDSRKIHKLQFIIDLEQEIGSRQGLPEGQIIISSLKFFQANFFKLAFVRILEIYFFFIKNLQYVWILVNYASIFPRKNHTYCIRLFFEI